MKMIEILKNAIDELKYKPVNLLSENIAVTDILLLELFNPANAYDYFNYSGIYYYNDSDNIRFCVRLVYQPTKNPFWELKSWWVDPKSNRAVYSHLPDNTNSTELTRRSDTTAAIFKNEIIPLFEKQDLSNIMKIIPMDSKRYNYSLRLVKKFIPTNWEITENYPKLITVTKPE